MIKLAALYSAFAAISIAVNIASQNITLQILKTPALARLFKGMTSGGDGTALWIAIFVGTATGLVTKYLLDKKYIFRYQTIG